MVVVSKGVVNTEKVVTICKQLRLNVDLVDAPIIRCTWKQADLDIVLAYLERRIDVIEFVEPDVILKPDK
jgi:hypothetical protein